jgi:ArsR family transcriptional regulator
MSKEQAHAGRDDSFRALADPTRRKILRMLNGGEMTAGDIANQFEISGPSMSHHFNVLKNADLIRTRRNGQQILYSLNTTVVQDLLAHLFDLFPTKKNQEVL